MLTLINNPELILDELRKDIMEQKKRRDQHDDALVRIKLDFFIVFKATLTLKCLYQHPSIISLLRSFLIYTHLLIG